MRLPSPAAAEDAADEEEEAERKAELLPNRVVCAYDEELFIPTRSPMPEAEWQSGEGRGGIPPTPAMRLRMPVSWSPWKKCVWKKCIVCVAFGQSLCPPPLLGGRVGETLPTTVVDWGRDR